MKVAAQRPKVRVDKTELEREAKIGFPNRAGDLIPSVCNASTEGGVRKLFRLLRVPPARRGSGTLARRTGHSRKGQNQSADRPRHWEFFYQEGKAAFGLERGCALHRLRP